MKRILYVLHSGITGGTFLTNKDLMKHVEKEFDVYLLGAENDYLRLFKYSEDNLNLIKEYPRNMKSNVPVEGHYTINKKWSAKDFHNSWLSYIYFDILINYNIDIVHIRHLINHSFDLPQVAKKLDVPVVLSIHDFYFLCPFYTLLDENNEYCEAQCSNNNKNCFCPMKSLSDINSKEIIPTWRENVLKMFSYVDYFITTSEIVKELFLSVYTDRNIINNENFKVIEHGRDFPKINGKLYEVPSEDKPIKILCPANHLNVMKGSELIKKIKEEDKENRLEFHFLGNCHDGIEEYGIAHGTFERDEFYKKVEEIKPSFIGIFSIWPETFCHTLTEAWSCGIPVIGTNIGVIQDRILKNNGGWIIDKDDSKKSYNIILNIVMKERIEKDSFLNIQSNIRQIIFKSTEEMAEEYMIIYQNSFNKN